eukprot:scaffold3960_cov148-Amphora_coffeaeformis.AAC.3
MAGVQEMAFFGSKYSTLIVNDNNTTPLGPVFLNTHDPFCLAMVGGTIAGNSGALSCVLESCLLDRAPNDVIRLAKPMTTLVLHFSPSSALCEAVGLLKPSLAIPHGLAVPVVPRDRAVVLVSPTYYKQRKASYSCHQCSVRPLLFRWKTLTSDHIKRIMGDDWLENKAHAASFVALLRRYQRYDIVPHFPQFLNELKHICNLKESDGIFDQGVSLLETFVAESQVNADIVYDGLDICAAVEARTHLLVVDLTDPLLKPQDVNRVFQVATKHFRNTTPTNVGKLLALDGAHHFMNGSTNDDGLSQMVVEITRQMHCENTRIVVSVETPKALSTDLLDIVSVVVLCRFISLDWWDYLGAKLPSLLKMWEIVSTLGSGSALVVLPGLESEGKIMRVAIRRLLTQKSTPSNS